MSSLRSERANSALELDVRKREKEWGQLGEREDVYLYYFRPASFIRTLLSRAPSSFLVPSPYLSPSRASFALF